MAAQKILVIKLSALGDFVQALVSFSAIRNAHPDAHITLLTTRPYAAFAKDCPYFDAVIVDKRPKIWQIGAIASLAGKLIRGRFKRVYDLQTSDRSSFYYRLFPFWKKPEWSGIASGCSLPHDNPERDKMHTLDRQAEQLKIAGIDDIPALDLSWVKADIDRFSISEPFALLVPGAAAHRPDKRWAEDKYAALGGRLLTEGITPVLIGSETDRPVIEAVKEACPEAVSVMGRTSFSDIAALARKAQVAVGNDTGPMHLIAMTGCPSVVLYSAASDPTLCGQRGDHVELLQVEDFETLPPTKVYEAVKTVRNA